MKHPLIIFDCDGTLVDSELLNNMAMVEVLQGFGLAQYDLDHALEHFTGLRFSQILETINRDTGFLFPPDAAKGYLSAVRRLAPTHMKAVPGAEELVRHASSRSKISVVSNGERNNVLMSLEMTGLRHLFSEEHIFTGLMAAAKPAPDLFLLAMDRLGERAAETLIIEDSVVGVTGGVAAGATVWGFTGTHHAPEKQEKALKNAGAKWVFGEMTEALAEIIPA
ncbi:MAG: HAD family phosphatase [Rhodospirillales bacterium]|nr:HAD family phosphatase [Alphaproteobacteria bacterium]MCB1840421.1 HAD family phosphatase [Alphaproteobacteria bacterium]MCB9977326.1 HAD family phosphatase [Rhodospirillales bacterium]